MADNDQQDSPNKLSANRDLVIGGTGGTILALAIGAFPWFSAEVKTFLLVFAPGASSFLTWRYKVWRLKEKQKSNKIVADDAQQTIRDIYQTNRGLTPIEIEYFRGKYVNFDKRRIRDYEDRIDTGDDL